MSRPAAGRGGARIRARGWGWRHAGRDSAAVHGLDLDVEAGERILLLGPSGAGKSTLLHALAGILGGEEEGDESGELSVDGMHPADARGVSGLVLQDPDTQAVLARVGDDVAFGCENLGLPRDEIWHRVHRALEEVGLDVPLDRSTSALSGGQKQRLALAGVLAMGPRLLLLDEPTANLDPAGVMEVRDAVERTVASTGATLVVIEHRVDVWVDLVDRVVVLDPEGGVLADGTPDAVLSVARAALDRAGVWLPGVSPEDRRRVGPLRRVAVTAEALAIGRERPSRRRRAGGSVVAEGLELALGEGTVTALVGPNGVGKSTLALTVAGLLEPVRGALRVSEGIAAGLTPHPHRWSSRQLAARSAMVFQEPEHQFLTATVRDELLLGPLRSGLPAAEASSRADAALERLGLALLADANPFTLSGGEKRRLSVATALVGRTPVVVLDEPTFGQDRRTWGVVVDMLAQARDAGAVVLAATHDRHLIDSLADATVTMESAPTAMGVVR